LLPENFCLGLLVEDECNGLLDVHFLSCYRKRQLRTYLVQSQKRTICRETGQSKLAEEGLVAGSRHLAAKFQKRPFGLKQIRAKEIAGSGETQLFDGDQCATTNL